MQTQKHLLASHIRPQKYELTIKPDLEAFVFEGWENIDLEIGKAGNEITLHAKNIEIESGEFFTTGKKSQLATKITYDKKSETATLHFTKKIVKGVGCLRLVFRGLIGDDLRGFYRSKYKHAGQEKYLGVTQFEPTDARRAFPCFDEPTHKAVFEINIVYPSHLSAISNTDVVETKPYAEGWHMARFAPSPKMSTYLVAYMVGEFEYLESYTKKRKNPDGKSNFTPVRVRVYTCPGKKEQGRFALETAVRALEFFENYFDIAYPLPVLDLIALPDFSSAAMENWGAVTYREDALLIDVKNSSPQAKQWVAIVIVHELAHQWFGNLVTMQWWTHLWLNEGFASYMENFGTDKLFPKWGIWQQFCAGRSQSGFILDSLESTHPIEVEVKHPSEIGQIFDMISYAKGASVIYMLAEYLGEKVFRDGLRKYLKKYAYSNAVTEHLWQALEEVSRQPVEKIMRNWTSLPGHPMVSVEPQGKDTYIFSQERFYQSRGHKAASKDNSVWQIPINISLPASRKVHSLILSERQQVVKIPGQNSWLKLNATEAGFYRVRYPSVMLEKLAGAVKTKKLPAQDRLGVLRDVRSLAEAGEISITGVLKILPSYVNENDFSVWSLVAGSLQRVIQLCRGSRAEEASRVFAREIYEKTYSKLGWEPKKTETHNQALMRGLLLDLAVSNLDKQALETGVKLFSGSQKGKFIDPALRSAVYGAAVLSESPGVFKKLFEMHENADSDEERERIGMALARTPNAKEMQKFLDWVFSAEVRDQDKPFLLAGALRNPKRKEQVWQRLQKSWSEIRKRYSSGGSLLGYIIGGLASFDTPELLAEVKNFFSSNPLPGATRVLAQTMEKIEITIDFRQKALPEAEQWFKQNGYAKKTSSRKRV